MAPDTPNGIVNYTVIVRERDLLSNGTNIVATEVISGLFLIVETVVRPYTEYVAMVTAQTGGGVGDSVMTSQDTDEESKLLQKLLESLM